MKGLQFKYYITAFFVFQLSLQQGGVFSRRFRLALGFARSYERHTYIYIVHKHAVQVDCCETPHRNRVLDSFSISYSFGSAKTYHITNEESLRTSNDA